MPDDDRRVLEARFDAAMLEIYERAGLTTGYWANYFRRAVLRKGGLPTARQLLMAAGTSKGFERLKAERRLDLSVEALVLRPEYRDLFTTTELDRARARLDRYGYRSPTEAEAAEPPSTALTSELEALLASVEAAAPGERMEFRNRVAEAGPAARDAMAAWLVREHHPAFAIGVLAHMAVADALAMRTIEAYAMRGGHDQKLATAALDRLHNRRAGQAPGPRVSLADVYQSSGVPEAALGVGCEVPVHGRACSNPGRHPIDGRIMCTTHRKAWELAQARGRNESNARRPARPVPATGRSVEPATEDR